MGELKTSTERLRDLDLTPEELGDIDETYLFRMADSGAASVELKNCAHAVRSGECTWRDVIEDRIAIPPEIRRLIDLGIGFAFTDPVAAPPETDDDEQWGPPRSWLEN